MTPAHVIRKNQFIDHDDLDNALFFCKLSGTYPFDVNDRIKLNKFSVGVMVLFYVYQIIARSQYIQYVISQNDRQNFQFIIHLIEVAASIVNGIGIMVATGIYWKNSESYLEVKTEIKSLLAYLDEKSLPKPFVFRSKMKGLYLIPLFVLFVDEVRNIHDFSKQEVYLLVLNLWSHLRNFGFILMYSVHVTWISHVYDSISNFAKKRGNLAVQHGVTLCKIEENLFVLSEKINRIFAPALIPTVTKFFIVMVNNLFWTLTAKQDHLKLMQFMRVMLGLSLSVMGFSSAEYCLDKVKFKG
ncbi:Hypothetical protein NTJ_13388 [Nesidiocoris tenuis]|uniref:Gustatory receptor n=1 Tax=Nesidiocoris tenuis TaxID=355587 RepID=A0ABN7B866_9HEMI|nr:Hypothetical protein NTJ_13388 [Nesidiocoris tenuis]